MDGIIHGGSVMTATLWYQGVVSYRRSSTVSDTIYKKKHRSAPMKIIWKVNENIPKLITFHDK